MNSPELLTAAYLAGDLPEAESQALADRLREDAAFRRAFVDQCWLDCQLRDVFVERRIHANLHEIYSRLAARPTPVTSVPHTVRASVGRVARYLRQPAVLSVLFATTTLLLFIVTAAQYPVWFNRHASRATTALPDGPKFVAALVRVVDAKWAINMRPLRLGERLSVRQELSLEHGLAEIAYDNGAHLVLQAPGKYSMAGPNGIEMGAGRLTVFAPPSAYGFQVSTPEAFIVDLGTEFGVSVDGQGNTEVHVFAGEVRTSSATKAELSDLRLVENQSVTYLAGGLPQRVARAQPEQFVRSSHAAVAGKAFQQIAGARHLAFEAEHFHQKWDRTVDKPGWLKASIATPIEFAGRPLLPRDTNAAEGAAIIAAPQPPIPLEHAGLATYQLLFQEPGLYHVYLRVSVFECCHRGSYGNEDSLFLPVPHPRGGFGPASLPLHNLGTSKVWDLRSIPVEGRYDWWSRKSTFVNQAVNFEPYSITRELLGRRLAFSLSTREGGLSVDRIVLSRDGQLTSAELDALPNSPEVDHTPAAQP